jgi:hypothetical protein
LFKETTTQTNTTLFELVADCDWEAFVSSFPRAVQSFRRARPFFELQAASLQPRLLHGVQCSAVLVLPPHAGRVDFIHVGVLLPCI